VVGAGSADAAEVDEPDAMVEEPGLDEEPVGDPAAVPAGLSGVKVELDRVVRPGTVVSGTVTFSDGTAGKWRWISMAA